MVAVLLSLSVLTMITHVVWFIIFGHLSFPKMPCETTIFFFGPVNDYWMGFWMDLLTVFLLFSIFLVVGLTTLWSCGFCLIPAVKILVLFVQSILYRDLSLWVRYRSVVQLQSASLRYLRFSKILEWFAAQPGSIRNKYGSALSRAYTMTQPVHGQHRRCILVFKLQKPLVRH